MVRLLPLKHAPAGNAPLFLSLPDPVSAEPILVLCVDSPRLWLLDEVTVLVKPPGSNVGSRFGNLTQVMGQLQDALPPEMRGPLKYFEYLRAYIVEEDRFDEGLVEDIPYVRYGDASAELKHSPRQATVRVRCYRHPEDANGRGRWVPIGWLRPFAPPDMSDGQVQLEVQTSMLKVRCGPAIAQ